ncbi:MAG TPA: protein kinase [Terriglobia bacterium]|nr:protein kinase [Terriglobia bacterium]
MFKTGRYEIVGELGRGSMGIVYEGYDPLIHRRVAIKTMRIEGLSGREYEQYKARFQAEAQAAGVLEHPNIVTIHDFGEDNGVLYLAMEFLKGRSLREIVDEKGILPIENVIPIFQQVSSALDHAHEHHIIHRDIKPANIMVLDSGLVKVTDFGIAKVLSTETGMTYSGQILGTPNYMSPEQVKGERVDGRSDIFALGVILYELVTGQKPFGGQNVTTVMYKIINEAPTSPLEVDPAIHAGLAYITNRALAKRPEDRYQTCRALADDLTNYKNLVKSAAASETMVARRSPLGGVAQAGVQATSPAKVRRLPLVGAVAAALVVVVGLAAGYYFRSRQRALTAAPNNPPANVEAATTTPSPAANPSSTAPNPVNSNPAGAGSAASGAPTQNMADGGRAPASPSSAAGETTSPASKVDTSHPKESKEPKELSSTAQEKKSRSVSRNAAGSSAAGEGSAPSRVQEAMDNGSSPPPRRTEVAKAERAPTPPAPSVPSGPLATAQTTSGSPTGGSGTNTSVASDATAPGSEYVLETDPIGIDVFIDGKLWGRTDKDKPVVASLAAGDHTLILKYHGVEVLKRQIKKTNDAQWQRWKLPITEPVP